MLHSAGLSGKLNQSSALLQEPSSIQKIAEIDQHIGVAMSGLTADAKTLIDRARVETQVLVRCSLRCPAFYLSFNTNLLCTSCLDLPSKLCSFSNIDSAMMSQCQLSHAPKLLVMWRCPLARMMSKKRVAW